MRSWLLLLLQLSTFAKAEDCSPINLYEKADNPLNKMPIYDQDGDGSCYAYTSAQLIDYYNLKKNPNHKLSSALWIAFAHKFRNRHIMSNTWNKLTSLRRTFGVTKPSELGFSDMNLALRDIRDMGICDEDVVKEGIKNFKLSDKINDDEFLFLFNRLSKKIKTAQDTDPYIDEEDKKRIFDEALNDLIRTRDIDILYKPDRKTTLLNLNDLKIRPSMICEKESPSKDATDLYHQVMSVFSFEKKNRQLQLLKNEVFAKCFEPGNNKKVEVPKFEHVGEMYSNNTKLLGAIDKALEKRDAPAGIGYCAKVLESPDFDPPVQMAPHGVPPLPRILRLADNENVQKCSPHYSMIVGRRLQGTSCQYMIRNTYGSHFWNQHMDCTCEKDGKHFNCNYKTHGHLDIKVLGCWINGKNLAESTFSVTYFLK